MLPSGCLNKLHVHLFFPQFRLKNKVCELPNVTKPVMKYFLKAFWLDVIWCFRSTSWRNKSNCEAIHEVMKQVPQNVEGHDIHSLLELYSLSG